jgi:molecular chaperone GrpE
MSSDPNAVDDNGVEEQQNSAPEAPEASSAEQENAEELSVEQLTEKLAQTESKLAEQQEAALRVQAELENLRRRTERDVANAHKFGLEKFALELLPIIDGLERGIQANQALNVESIEDESAKGAIKSMSEGIEMTLGMFASTLEKFGVTAIDPTGQAFNPEQHEAMSMQESPDHEPNTVIAVMQKGYLLNGRLIRPAMVMVSKPSAKIDAKA